jgi:hypothetical protein
MNWRVGDRCIVALPNRHAVLRAGLVDVLAEVTGVDDGPRPGVSVRFIEPRTLNGLSTCYATHRELRRP